MKRYGDLDKLYDSVKENVGAYYGGEQEVKEACLEEILSAHEANIAEVIRCHDCAYCTYNTSSFRYKCDRRGYFSEEVDPNDFCSKAKKKGEDGE